jgi:serine/threonine-protein kinase
MAKDPSRRYRTATELAEAATAALLDERTIPAVLPRATVVDANTYQPQPPSGPWQPGPYPQYPAPPRRSRARLLGLLAAVAVVAVAVIVTAAVLARRGDDSAAPAPPPTSPTTTATTTPTTTTPAKPPAPPVPASALQGLLLGTDELANLAGAAGVIATQTAPVLSDDAAAVDDKDCVGAWVPSQREVYGDSGWTAVQQQLLRSAGDGPPTHTITQMVASFPTTDAAALSVNKQADQWARCAGRTITATITQPPTSVTYTFGKPSTKDGVVSMRETREGGNGWGCERAVGARNNVVADIMVCRYDPAGQAVAIINAVLGRVPQ